MKIIHLSDLHLGKMLHGVSLLENGDQVDWVEKFLALAARECPDAVVIAGDIYDRSMPSGAAMQLFSRLVTELSNRNVPVLIRRATMIPVRGFPASRIFCHVRIFT